MRNSLSLLYCYTDWRFYMPVGVDIIVSCYLSVVRKNLSTFSYG